MKTILGIDEAGRGCVLGPMVITGVLFEDDRDVFEELRLRGIKDSKLLTASKRAELASYILKLKKDVVTFAVSPKKIDAVSLNRLGKVYTSKVLDKLKPDKAYIDVPARGSGIAKYCSDVSAMCTNKKTQIFGGNHFDSIHLVVSCASILAKERREHEVRKLHKKFGDFGSGYPHDPKTQAWLSAWMRTGENWPSIVRTKWETVSRLQLI